MGQMKELKAAIGPLSGRSLKYCTDSCLKRYLEARNWNVDKSKKMLEDTLRWRSTYKPEDIRWVRSSAWFLYLVNGCVIMVWNAVRWCHFLRRRLLRKGRQGNCTEQVFMTDKKGQFLFWGLECRYHCLEIFIFNFSFQNVLDKCFVLLRKWFSVSYFQVMFAKSNIVHKLNIQKILYLGVHGRKRCFLFYTIGCLSYR